jgi:hypothetical protein
MNNIHYNLRSLKKFVTSQTLSRTEDMQTENIKYITPVKHKYNLRIKHSIFVGQLKETKNHKYITRIKHSYNLRSIRQVCKVLF